MVICVRHLLATLYVFAIGCYSDPDYAATRFRCDTAHVCPDGQVCVNGACSGGSPSGQAGVACGGTTCGAGQVCCLDFIAGPSCMASSADCDGAVATCDGVEDCNGNACCERALGLPITCGSTAICVGPAAEQICRDAADCTDPSARACCFGLGLPGEPWGRCESSCPPA